ncbi:hypothetical protein E4N74_04240 [Treponema putidum]|uniref:Uncharacterized protein n=1 Tax=Treponema putidum TaxID=221027 RepID=A0AAE9MSH4_9SPIR|nr:hypothetical protein E4N74_04240 [Treponema putidum]
MRLVRNVRLKRVLDAFYLFYYDELSITQKNSILAPKFVFCRLLFGKSPYFLYLAIFYFE